MKHLLPVHCQVRSCHFGVGLAAENTILHMAVTKVIIHLHCTATSPVPFMRSPGPRTTTYACKHSVKGMDHFPPVHSQARSWHRGVERPAENKILHMAVTTLCIHGQCTTTSPARFTQGNGAHDSPNMHKRLQNTWSICLPDLHIHTTQKCTKHCKYRGVFSFLN